MYARLLYMYLNQLMRTYANVSVYWIFFANITLKSKDNKFGGVSDN